MLVFYQCMVHTSSAFKVIKINPMYYRDMQSVLRGASNTTE